MSSKKKIVIEVDKSKFIKVSLCVVGVILLCLICFFASCSNMKEYQKNTQKEATEDNSLLEQATKEAGEISDEERVKPKDISVDEYLKKYNSEDYSLVLISREDCSYCKIAIPIIENILYTEKIEMSHIDVGKLTEEEVGRIVESNSYFSSGFGTPLVLVIGNHEIKGKLEGLSIKELYQQFFKEYGFMG